MFDFLLIEDNQVGFTNQSSIDRILASLAASIEKTMFITKKENETNGSENKSGDDTGNI